MIILDTLLIGSLRFVLDKIAEAVEAEADDESALRRQLLEAQMQLELGDISDKEFRSIERSVLAQLRRLKGERPDSLTMSPGVKVDIDLKDH